MKLASNIKMQGKKRFVRRMFDDIYPRYDLLNTILSSGMDDRWRKKAVEDVPPAGTIIDLCGGGGQLSRQLLERSDFQGKVVIADISPRMISQVRRVLGHGDYGRRYFAVICDVECLPFREGLFDAAISAFSLRNLDDLSTFSGETMRVLKRESCARFLEIGHPRGKILKFFFELYFYRLGPVIARLFTDKKYAYDYLPMSLKIFPHQNEVLKTLSASWDESDLVELWRGIAVIYRLSKGPDGTG
jgi:demethylmenaquinone methyltransferase/2-methoxy-6-polyprenyl-1,4-benzoquinol methylase